jgi:hypothetical protein
MDCVCVCVVLLRMEPKALYILDKHSTTEHFGSILIHGLVQFFNKKKQELNLCKMVPSGRTFSPRGHNLGEGLGTSVNPAFLVYSLATE